MFAKRLTQKTEANRGLILSWAPSRVKAALSLTGRCSRTNKLLCPVLLDAFLCDFLKSGNTYSAFFVFLVGDFNSISELIVLNVLFFGEIADPDPTPKFILNYFSLWFAIQYKQHTACNNFEESYNWFS